ncbi:MAG: DNA primase [Flavobacteriaceae bacterium]|nr:DNA primase [Flavobacteriaceae bacterium]
MIHKSTIDAVFDTARLEEVIGDFVQLKKSGANFKGLSPFTDERSPSFMVSPVKQIWKDFSSGKGGNVVTFLMEHEHFSYPEAIRYLAKKYNIDIAETEQNDEQKAAASERESMYLVSNYAVSFFEDNIWNTPQGKAIGLSYFKERGFSEETIRFFQLGYSPNTWSAFTDAALKAGYQLNFLEKIGLSILKGDKKFDRFKGRVMFPIHSMSGRVLGFGGRILTQDKKAAKYMNSPESEIYNKSKVLYGLYQAKHTIAKENNCYLVEGYTDVIQMYQRGVKNVVSSSGTALTTEQIRLIGRLSKNITVLFDGDPAGLRASLRGIDLILEAGMNVRVCMFPEGEDPDSFARENSVEDVIDFFTNNSKDFIQFKAALLVDEAAQDPVKKAETIREMVKSIAKIPDRIKQEVYVKSCASLMEISEEVLFATLAQVSQKKIYKPVRQAPSQPMSVVPQEKRFTTVSTRFELEKDIIKILLLHGHEKVEFEEPILKTDEKSGELSLVTSTITARVFEKIYMDLQQDEIAFSTTLFKDLYSKVLTVLNEKLVIEMDTFVANLDPNLALEVSDLLLQDELHTLHDWERKNIYIKNKKINLARWVQELILRFRCHLIDEKVAALQSDTAENTDSHHGELLEEIVQYHKLKTVLSGRLNRVV